jgi:brefeldin A-resistance guanine nucleotide exchange factor 1
MRVDEALRIYLSEFRLPGEAPLISTLLEHFAAHWRVRVFLRFFY